MAVSPPAGKRFSGGVACSGKISRKKEPVFEDVGVIFPVNGGSTFLPHALVEELLHGSF